MIVVAIKARREGEDEFGDAPIKPLRRQHHRHGEHLPADHAVAVAEPRREHWVIVDVTHIGRPIEPERPVDGVEIGVLQRQVRRRRDIGQRRHHRGDQRGLRQRAEHEHHLRIAPLRRCGIGVGKAAVDADIADGDRHARQRQRKVGDQEAQRQHGGDGGANEPIELEKPPRGFHLGRQSRSR